MTMAKRRSDPKRISSVPSESHSHKEESEGSIVPRISDFDPLPGTIGALGLAFGNDPPRVVAPAELTSNFDPLPGTIGALGLAFENDPPGVVAPAELTSNFDPLPGTIGALGLAFGNDPPRVVAPAELTSNFDSLPGTIGALGLGFGNNPPSIEIPMGLIPSSSLGVEAPEKSPQDDVETREPDLLGGISRDLWLLNDGWAAMWDGALHALSCRGPDSPRHVASSLRALLWSVMDKFAPKGDKETDRQRFRRILMSRSRGDLAASTAELGDRLIARLSTLDKQAIGSDREAHALVFAAGSVLLLVLPD